MQNTDTVKNEFKIFLTELAQDYKALKAAGNNNISIQTKFVDILSDIQIETFILFLQETDKNFTKHFITHMIANSDCKNKNVIKIINSFKDVLFEIKTGTVDIIDKNIILAKFLYNCNDINILERQYCIFGSQLKYHKDWNALMEIISKINSFQQCENARRDMQYTIAYLLGGGYRFSKNEISDVLDMTIENLFERCFEWVDYNKNGYVKNEK